MVDKATDNPKLILRNEVAAKIEARLAGKLGAAALAAWAFERFYAEELGNLAYEPGAEAVLANVLDALMFSDEADFGLDEAELRALHTQLQ